jgi:hypothetical protein
MFSTKEKLLFVLAALVAAMMLIFVASGCTSLRGNLKNDRYNMGPLPAEKKPAGELTSKEVRELKKSRPRYFLPAVGQVVKPSANPLDEALPYGIIAVWRHEYEPPLLQLAAFKPPTRAVLLFRFFRKIL